MLTDFLLSCHTFYRNTNTLVYIYWCILINIGVPALCTESKTHFLRLTHSLSTTEVRKRQEYVELWLMNLPTCFKWISYSPRRGEKCNFFWKMEMYKWNAQNKKKIESNFCLTDLAAADPPSQNSLRLLMPGYCID